ncbi:KTSC domain-containing protein [Chitinophagaceae bacterium MMS25-I14]
MPSTVIAAMHYNSEKTVLTITFVTGAVYEYIKVPENVYTAMKAAQSKGAYFNKKIRNRYKFRKIK